jgi:Tol biopolymer transport system component
MKPKPLFKLFILALLIAACGSAVPLEMGNESVPVACKQIIFSYGVHGRNHFEDNIVSSCPDGSNKVRLTIDGKGNGAPLWSPDGSQIAFVSARSGSSQLYVMDADGSNVEQLTSGLEFPSPFAWLPGGQHIVLRPFQAGGSLEWAVVNIATKEISTLNWQLAPSFSSAELSHDGSRLAYVQAMNPADRNGPSQIRVQQTDGSNDYALTDDIWVNYNPVWSADDSQLVFFTNRDGVEGLFAIYAVSADGSDLRALTEPIFGVGSFFSWSPDGGSVAVFNDGAIYVTNLDNGEMTKLFTVDYPNYVSNFSWRP